MHRIGCSTMDFPEISATNPVRPLNWRWQLAGELIEAVCRPGLLVEAIDQRLLPFRESLFGKRSPSRVCPWHQAAYRIYRAAERPRLMLETWLLTNLPCAEVAHNTGVPEEVVATYHDTFFDVAPWYDAQDSLLSGLERLLRSVPDRPPFDVSGMAWRRMAYFGGEPLLKALWAAFPESDEQNPTVSECNSPADLDSERARLLMRLESLNAAKLSPDQWVDLRHRFDVYLRLRRKVKACSPSREADSDFHVATRTNGPAKACASKSA